jgi:hypothetical protein
MKYYGDFLAGKTVRARFNTTSPTTPGLPTTLSSPSVIVSKDGADVTPSGGVTITADAGSVTGRNHVVIDMSVDPTTFTAGSEYAIRLGGTSNVSGTSQVGIVVGEWSIQNRSILGDATGKVAVAAGSSPLAGVTVAGSTASSLILSGLPTGRSYVGQRLYHQVSGEARAIAAQTPSGGNYTFTFGTGTGEAGPFSIVPATGDPVYPVA